MLTIHLTTGRLLGAKYCTRLFGDGGKMSKVRCPPEGSWAKPQEDPLQFLQPKVLGLNPNQFSFPKQKVLEEFLSPACLPGIRVNVQVKWNLYALKVCVFRFKQIISFSTVLLA